MKGVLVILLMQTVVISQNTDEYYGILHNDVLDVEGVSVVNSGLKVATITNESGEFKIKANVNDTLQVVSMLYKSMMVIVTKSSLRSEKNVIHMEPRVSKLDEVVLSTIALTGDLYADTQNIELNKEPLAQDFGLPKNTLPPLTTEERRLYSAQSSGLLGSLVNSLTGRTKMLKRHVKISKLKQRVKKLRYSYSDSLYTFGLKLEKNLIDDFMYFVVEKLDSLNEKKDADKLDFLEFMKNSRELYVRLKASEK